jgi:hypothetical protein
MDSSFTLLAVKKKNGDLFSAYPALPGGQDSLVGKALDCTDRKVLGSILASTTKGAQHERLVVSPCEIIKIC